MEPEPRKRPIRFYEIDLLRFLAALAVVVYHYTYRGYAEGHYSPLPFVELGQFTRYGYLGVELFFIISGYVVLLSAQGKTVRQFFVSRLTRLYPAFWGACTLTFVVERLWGTRPGELHMSPFLSATPVQYLFNLSMVPDLLGITAIDRSYWSLTVEITFYFLISLLIGYQLLRHVELFLLVWLAYAALPSVLHTHTPFAVLFFPSYAPYFVAGMLFYLLQQPQGQTRLRYVLLLAAYGLAIRAALGQTAELAAYYHDTFSRPVAAGVITAFFVLFYLIAFRKLNLSRFTWLAWPGALTYPLYLIHSDIGFIAFHRLHHHLPKYVLLPLALIVMVVTAYFIHVLIEKRLGNWLGQQANKWLTQLDQRP